MAKNVTTWSNNDVKPADQWSAVAKNNSQWTNGVTKATALFTVVARTTANWLGIELVQTPYTYDSASMTYDSASIGYEYTNPVTNQLNTKNTTPWSAT